VSLYISCRPLLRCQSCPLAHSPVLPLVPPPVLCGSGCCLVGGLLTDALPPWFGNGIFVSMGKCWLSQEPFHPSSRTHSLSHCLPCARAPNPQLFCLIEPSHVQATTGGLLEKSSDGVNLYLPPLTNQHPPHHTPQSSITAI
jgi:hypothetical protein